MVRYVCPLFVGLFTLFCASSGFGSLGATRLRCESLVSPLGIGETAPRLSWIDLSSAPNMTQTAYQVLCSSKPNGPADFWDSGTVASDDSTQVVYAGRPLRSRDRVYWRVKIWDQTGHASPYSQSSVFEEGLLEPSDWNAQWISSSPDPLERSDSLANWMWTDEGDPAKEAPSGSRWFRARVLVPGGQRIDLAQLRVLVDDHFTVLVNGTEIAHGDGFSNYTVVPIGQSLHPGENTVEIKATNDKGPAGLAVLGEVKFTDGSGQRLDSPHDWQAASSPSGPWKLPKVLGPVGMKPWGLVRPIVPPDRAAYFRKRFSVDKAVARARVYASARGLYELYLDGRKVGSDLLRPGWTDYNRRIQYQTYDVTRALGAGAHALGLIVGDGWYSGNIAWAGRNQYGRIDKGLAQLEITYSDGTSETISTDGSWRAGGGPILQNDLYMGETYDARDTQRGWATAGFDDTSWKTPYTLSVNGSRLVSQMDPSVRVLATLPAKALSQPKPGVWVFDLGQNMVGHVRLKVSGPRGATILIRHAEMLNPDGTAYTTNLRHALATDSYTLSGNGVETYEPTFTFHGFRYVELTGFPGVPKLDAVTGIVVGTDSPQTGTFECSSSLVNSIQHNILWGQRGNYLEVPTDCPQRDERLGWMGDAQIFVRTACFNNDVESFHTKWTQDVVDAQSSDGGFSDVSPRVGDPADGAPAWGDAGVIVPWTIYQCYGDKRLLERRYDAMASWVHYIDSANPDHLWVKRSNNNFGDWLNVNDPTPAPVLATAYFAHDADLMARISTALGKQQEAEAYTSLFEQIKAAFQRAYVRDDGFIQGDSQTDYVLALWFDLLPSTLRQAAADRLVRKIEDRKMHLSTGFVGTGYLAPVLSSIGRSDIAYKLLTSDTYPSWGFEVKNGATTMWERWDGWTPDKGFEDPGMNSFNHYAFGAIGQWMYSDVGGIDLDPSQPGYKRFVIHPRMDPAISWAKAALESVHGRISSSWKRAKGHFELNVVVPPNTSALVVVPTAGAITATGGKLLRTEGGLAFFEVGSGSYRFVSPK